MTGVTDFLLREGTCLSHEQQFRGPPVSDEIAFHMEINMNKILILSAVAGSLMMSTAAFAANDTDFNIATDKVVAIKGDVLTLKSGLKLTAETPAQLKKIHVGERISADYNSNNVMFAFERA